MIKKIAAKISGLVIILLILSFFVFTLLYIAPGDPAEKRLTSQGVIVTKEVLLAEQERLGLLRPFFVRYGEWLFGVVRGDFGQSFKDDLPVAPKLMKGLQKTLTLATTSLLFSLIISYSLALLSAFKKDKISDHIIRIISFVGNSLPNFLISVLLMYFFCIKMDLFPVIADGTFKGLILPVLSLSIPMISRFTRQMRSEMITQLSEDYVTGMRLRGVKELYIAVNVIRNSLGHVITIIGLQIGTLMGGSVVIETIFRWPGIGKLVMDSITARDYPVIMGFVIIMGTIYVVINQLTDLCYHLLDPRVKT
ncbi:ABC transporter permease [Butyrivibrio sp. AE2032]|uniref:ABC transporter permease n=1 Tax=Butyrivibrio sp. AE2032 TaxID=1458463 RepID=UPI000555BBDC|nr:ABC transporter permease [Butyrivibrio sp. AE2032]